MNEELLIEQMFQVLISGDRGMARRISDTAFECGISPQKMSLDIYWPLLDNVHTLYRQDQISKLAQQYATRTLSTLVSQAHMKYEIKESNGKNICMFSGPTELEDLHGRMVSDLLESEGYEVRYGGGNICYDDILEEIHAQKPDVLVMFASGPQDAPMIRQLIDHIRSVGAYPDMQIAVGGGIFNRAPGLAEEIGADLWAANPTELIDLLENCSDIRADLSDRTVGRSRGQNVAAA